MRRSTLMDLRNQQQEVYYNCEWWFVATVTHYEAAESKAYLIQWNPRDGITANAGWVSLSLIYSNPCKLCELPPDSFDMIYCQKHWEQEHGEAFKKTFALGSGARKE